MNRGVDLFSVAAVISVLFLLLVGGCSGGGGDTTAFQRDAQGFIESYTKQWLPLRNARELAEWDANIRIVAGDSSNAHRANATAEALAEFSGSKKNIDKARHFLERKDDLTELQRRQLELILYQAGEYPEAAGELVKQRIAAETAQTEKLFGFDFKLDGNSVSANEIDRILRESDDPGERLKVWESSKEVGIGLKDGLADLVRLRNGCVQALGYKDFFQYMVSDYGMSVDELMTMAERFNEELRPLYRELHTYARYELAEQYHQPVPVLLPADWLPNRWGQDWSPMVDVQGLNLDEVLKDSSAEYVMHAGEDFYVSLGYPKLPQSFWEKSSLYPLPPGADYKKNNHASAWHTDLDGDVRCLMSIEPNADWWNTVHHELGHIYYYLAYNRPEVPPLLRRGANRAYHEAIGSLMGMASMQQPFLMDVGLVKEDVQTDPMQALLREAMENVVFIPWSAGVMTQFEHDLYTQPLPKDQYNQRWWELKRRYQGIVPPSPRGEEYCDAASKTHINDDPAGYYDYALSFVLLQQLHEHIARDILRQDPHATDYFGSREVGDFIWSILCEGGTVDWRQELRDKTGSDLSAQAMLDYYAPLYEWLVEQNQGHTATLPDM